MQSQNIDGFKTKKNNIYIGECRKILNDMKIKQGEGVMFYDPKKNNNKKFFFGQWYDNIEMAPGYYFDGEKLYMVHEKFNEIKENLNFEDRIKNFIKEYPDSVIKYENDTRDKYNEEVQSLIDILDEFDENILNSFNEENNIENSNDNSLYEKYFKKLKETLNDAEILTDGYGNEFIAYNTGINLYIGNSKNNIKNGYGLMLYNYNNQQELKFYYGKWNQGYEDFVENKGYYFNGNDLFLIQGVKNNEIKSRQDIENFIKNNINNENKVKKLDGKTFISGHQYITEDILGILGHDKNIKYQKGINSASNSIKLHKLYDIFNKFGISLSKAKNYVEKPIKDEEKEDKNKNNNDIIKKNKQIVNQIYKKHHLINNGKSIKEAEEIVKKEQEQKQEDEKNNNYNNEQNNDINDNNKNNIINTDNQNNITQQALNGFEKIINRQNITEEEMQIITNLMNNGNNDNKTNFIQVFKHNYPRPSNWFVNTARDRRIINLHDALDNNNNITQQRLIDISNINSWKWVCGCSGV